MPVNNPYLIPKENFPKVEEVRYLEEQTPPKITFAYSQLPRGANVSYFFPEEPRNLTLEQQRLQELIEAAYRGEREAWNEIASYGPGWGEWLLKTTIVVGGSFVLGPIPALVVGGVTAGAAKVVEEVVDDEDTKKAFKFISDIGKDVAIGGAVGGLVQGVGGVLAADLGGVGSNAGRTAALKVLEKTGDFAAARAEYLFVASKHGAKVVGQIDKWFSLCKDAVVAADEAERHMDHIRDGYDYKSWCKVCNA